MNNPQNTSVFAGRGRRIQICEVGPRDGLQMEKAFVPTQEKIRLINDLSAAGLPKIEVSAFVSPKAIPALADADEVLRGITRRAGTVYAALVPNVRGAERALAARVDEINLVLSASETHNLCNLRMTRAQSTQALLEVVQLARASACAVNVSISCSFGCPMEGEVAEHEVWHIVETFARAGVRGVSLCDTTGMASPAQVRSMTAQARERWPHLALTLHLHDTRGLALANVLAAMEAGATQFDAALGGLGGCPYAPGASGNACTQDLVHALHLMGYETGVDLQALLAASARLPALIGHATASALDAAGPAWTRHPTPASFADIHARALARDGAQ